MLSRGLRTQGAGPGTAGKMLSAQVLSNFKNAAPTAVSVLKGPRASNRFPGGGPRLYGFGKTDF